MALGLLMAMLVALCPLDHVFSQPAPADATPPSDLAPDLAPDLADVLGRIPEGLSAEQIDAIVAVLTDTQAREALRSSLMVLAGPPPNAQPPLMARARTRLVETIAIVPQLPRLIDASAARDAAAGVPLSPTRGVLTTTLVVLLGFLAAGGVRLWSVRRQAERAGSWSAPVLSALVADLAAISAFAVVVVAIYLVWAPDNPRAPALLQNVLTVVCSGLGIAAAARLVLAPVPGAARSIPISDDAASDAWHWVQRLVAVTLVFAYPAILAAGLGLPEEAQLAARLVLSIAVIATAIVMVWHRRSAMASAFGADTDSARRQWAMTAALVLTFGLLVIWLLWAIGQLVGEHGVALRALGSLLVVFALPLVMRWIDRLLPDDAAVGLDRGPEAVGSGSTTTRKAIGIATTRHSIGRMVRAVTALAALWLIFRIWGFDPTAGEGALAAVMAIVFQGGVVVVLGYLVWLLLKGWLDRQIARAKTAAPTSSTARLATLLPILRTTLLTALAVVVTLSVLSSFGIAIGPLLAGAGVVGLAIGFGAQSLVKDIVSGFFFLLDDAFRVGEYVDTGKLRGTVEGMSLRSLRLRHHRGAVHTLPFGQIEALTNHSRDWVIEKLELSVRLDTDMAKVKAVLKQVGREMAADPDIGPNLIEPPKSQGVGRVSDFAIVVSVKFMAKPGEQFVIKRDAYRRIMEAFKANGIRLAYPTVTIEQPAAEASPEAALAAAKMAAMNATGTT